MFRNGVAQVVQLSAARLRNRSSIPSKGKRFSLYHSVKTGPGAFPASYPVIIWVISPRVKRPEREADRSQLSSAEVKNVWGYAFTPPYVFME
jgi:hypothetical protein